MSQSQVSIEETHHRFNTVTRSDDLDTESMRSIGVNFQLDGDTEILYSKEGTPLVRNVQWAFQINGHPRKAVVETKQWVIGSQDRIEQYEIVTDSSGDIVSSYSIEEDRRVNPDDVSSDRIDFLTIPEYNALINRLDGLGQRPPVSLRSGPWKWCESLKEQNEITCSVHECSNVADIRVHAGNGRLLFGQSISGDHITNTYCRHCMDLRPDEDVVHKYHNPNEKTELNEEYVEKTDCACRLVGKDRRNNLKIVISVAEPEYDEDDGKSYFVTVELVSTKTGKLQDRQTPTISKEQSDQAAKRALELYESYWDGEYGDDILFEIDRSKIIDPE